MDVVAVNPISVGAICEKQYLEDDERNLVIIFLSSALQFSYISVTFALNSKSFSATIAYEKNLMFSL